jgi:hypothetical protein
MCSTPQKQPAATVALAAFSGVWAAPLAPPGPRLRLVLELKGRKRREMKEGMLEAIVRKRRRRRLSRGMSRGVTLTM